jgi:hypothetical protein
VFGCPCGWRGLAIDTSRSRLGAAPTSCPRCLGTDITRTSEKHPRITRVCRDCGADFKSTSRKEPARCAKCRGQQASAQAWTTRRKKYDWTPQREAYLRTHYDGKVKRRAEAIARALGWPTWVIKKHAQQLGLAYPVDRKDYTAAEVALIEEWTGARSSRWIAKRLHRTETSVVLKQKRLGMSRRVRDGYTVGAVSECFGVDHHSVDRWIREGKLHATRRGTDRTGKQGDIYKITDADIKAFVRDHPTAFRLDKVDPVWFLDLVLGAPRHAIEAVA